MNAFQSPLSLRVYDSYHMQYFHGMSYLSSPVTVAECIASGIAASTARPFSPPIAFRTTPRQRPGKHERTQMLEGQCHRCMRWAPVQGVKDGDAKVLNLSLFLIDD